MGAAELIPFELRAIDAKRVRLERLVGRKPTTEEA